MLWTRCTTAALAKNGAATSSFGEAATVRSAASTQQTSGEGAAARSVRVLAVALVAVALFASAADAQCRRRSSSRAAKPKIMRPYRPPVTSAPAKIIQVQPARRIAVPPPAEVAGPGLAAIVASTTSSAPSPSNSDVAPAFAPVAGAAASVLASFSDTATVLLALGRVDWSSSTAPVVDAAAAARPPHNVDSSRSVEKRAQ
jgi:hypothetical protein